MYTSYADVLESYTIAEEGIMDKLNKLSITIFDKVTSAIAKLLGFLIKLKNKIVNSIRNRVAHGKESSDTIKYLNAINNEVREISKIKINFTEDVEAYANRYSEIKNRVEKIDEEFKGKSFEINDKLKTSLLSMINQLNSGLAMLRKQVENYRKSYIEAARNNDKAKMQSINKNISTLNSTGINAYTKLIQSISVVVARSNAGRIDNDESK